MRLAKYTNSRDGFSRHEHIDVKDSPGAFRDNQGILTKIIGRNEVTRPLSCCWVLWHGRIRWDASFEHTTPGLDKTGRQIRVPLRWPSVTHLVAREQDRRAQCLGFQQNRLELLKENICTEVKASAFDYSNDALL